mgnify:CR=1 FL=1
MEFVKSEDVYGVLEEFGISRQEPEGELIRLRMAEADSVVRLHLVAEGADVEPDEGDEILTVPPDRLKTAISDIIHIMHLTRVLLIPLLKWRNVFDAVAFSLAENEDWQEVDAAATVELNGRDPLLCDPGDFSTVQALVGALLTDAESSDQGLMMTAPSTPVLVEVIPEGALKISLGNMVLADEIREAFQGQSA